MKSHLPKCQNHKLYGDFFTLNREEELMNKRSSFLSEEFVLIILGAINANEADRKLLPSEAEPFRVFIDGELRTAKYFDAWSALGISSLAFNPDDPFDVFITKPVNEATRIVKLDLNEGSAEDLEIHKIRDVHEMIIYDRNLWLANTGFDEAVAFNIDDNRIINRIDLSSFKRSNASVETNRRSEEENVDRFHLNQVFKGMDGNLYGLVHHITGRQIVRKVGTKILKSQGNGGVIRLSTGEGIGLGLRSPHTVRIVGDDYWIMDSGNFCINIYDQDWRLIDSLKTKGYGRGADILPSSGIYFAGISEIRKRYLKLFPGSSPNMVQLIDFKSKQIEDEIIVETGVEQINNVYVIPREVGEAFLSL